MGWFLFMAMTVGAFPTTRGSGDNWEERYLCCTAHWAYLHCWDVGANLWKPLDLGLEWWRLLHGSYASLETCSLGHCSQELAESAWLSGDWSEWTQVDGSWSSSWAPEVAEVRTKGWHQMDHGQSDFVCLGQLPATMLPHWHSFVHWGSDICHQKVNTSGYQLWQSHSAPTPCRTIFALFEQAAALHASHGAAFSGSVAGCWLYHGSFFLGGSLAKVKGAELLQLYIFGGFMVSFILLISFDQLTSGLPTNITHQVWNCNITGDLDSHCGHCSVLFSAARIHPKTS